MPTVSVPYFMGEKMPGFAVPNASVVLEPALPEGTPQERMGALYRELADWVSVNPDPVAWCGDCVAAIGVVAGLQRRGISPTVLWFDAHGDFHTWETTHSGFLGGMPLAMLTGRGERTVMEAAGAEPLLDHQVWLIGARDVDPREDTALENSGVRCVTVAEMATVDLPPDQLHVHIDVDVVDPNDMPAVNYPAPSGPTLGEIAQVLRRIAETGRTVALSFSAWNPELPGADRAAAATSRLAIAYRQSST